MSQGSEMQQRDLFCGASILVCEVDITAALAEIAALRRQGTDPRAHLMTSADAARAVVSRVRGVDVDRAYLDALGVQSAEAFLDVLRARFLAETFCQVAAGLVALAGGSRRYAGASAIRSRGAERCDVHLTLHAFPPHEGQIHALMGMIDVSSRQRQGAPGLPEERYRTMVESLPQAIWMCEPGGALTYCNPAMAEMLGLAPDREGGGERLGGLHPDPTQGAPDDWLPGVPATWPQQGGPHGWPEHWSALCHPEDRPWLEAARRRARARGVAYRGECRLRTREGGYRHVAFVEAPIQGDGPGLAGWVGTITDITVLKQGQQSLQRALQRSHLDLAEIVRAASHDFQEPLRMVTSYVQLLARRYGDRLDSRASKYISYAVEGAGRMKDLLRDLRALYQAGSETQSLQPVPMDELVARVMAAMEDRIGASRAEISCGALPVVRADPRQIALLFRHLFENAIRFCGEAPPRISVAAEREGAMWRFAVQDHGIGFDAAAYGERVFLMFRRLHPRNVYPGTGIGLTIARKIVERHGGDIQADARPGEGATFRFTLPAMWDAAGGEDAAREAAAPASESAVIGPTGPPPGETGEP